MQKKVATTISVLSIIIGVGVIALQGGEGAVMMLGFWGIPCTLLVEPLSDLLKLDQYYSFLYYFFYFLQYQLLTLFIYKWRGFGFKEKESNE